MKRTLSLTIAGLAILIANPVQAHWCNNIFAAPARLVVKPERPTVSFSGSNPAQLRVYLRNNFPYTLFRVDMRGSASGYTVTVANNSRTINPGQNISFLLTITPSGSGGTLPSANLGLQVRFRSGSPYGWRGNASCMVNPSPSTALLRDRSAYGGRGTGNDCESSPTASPPQSATLTNATLADVNGSYALPNRAPTWGRTGIQQAIHYFGYRFCYNGSNGGWRASGQDCGPSGAAEGSAWSYTTQFAQNCMRAGVEVAVRKAQLGSNLTAARNGAVNALKGGGSAQHKCIAAIVGGWLYRGTTASAFTAALAAGANSVPARCQQAGIRALNGASASSCGSGAYYEQAACAAAEGMRNNDTPVRNILLTRAGDGQSRNGYIGLFYAYMLRMVVAYRVQTTGSVPFYPDAGGTTPTPDASVPTPDQAVPTPDQAVPTPDQAVPTPDRSVPTPDRAVPTPDRSVPTPDRAVPTPDRAVPKPDKAVPKPDKSVPTPDKSVPKTDGTPPVTDGSPPVTDGSLIDAPPSQIDGQVQPNLEAGSTTEGGTTNNQNKLDGGCSVGDSGPLPVITLLLLGLAIIFRRRR